MLELVYVVQLSVPSPSVPQSSHQSRNIGIAALVIGLVIGLALGISVSVLFNLPSSFHSGAGINNQVQVSGTVSTTILTQSGYAVRTISFSSLNRTDGIATSAPIVNGQYSVLLVGGKSYTVDIGEYYYSLYVPLGVTVFTANF